MSPKSARGRNSGVNGVDFTSFSEKGERKRSFDEVKHNFVYRSPSNRFDDDRKSPQLNLDTLNNEKIIQAVIVRKNYQ